MNLSGSFYLTEKFEAVATTNLELGSYEYNNEASYKVTAGPITKTASDFKTVTQQVIANLEGGYAHPLYHNQGDPRFSKSGETMFGIDRKTGGTINTSKAGVAFWKKIDEAQKTKKWRLFYIPPDPLKTELVDLVVQMIEPGYNDFIKRYVESLKNGKEVSAIINKDGRLKFNFIYASWNGPGWFKGFAYRTVAAYNSGKKTPDELLKAAISARINNEGVLGGGSPRRGNNDWSLINQGGLKIAKLVGVTV
jgi:hypothetical protein